MIDIEDLVRKQIAVYRAYDIREIMSSDRGAARKAGCPRFVAVLEIPPVVDAVTAVRVQIVKDVKEGNVK